MTANTAAILVRPDTPVDARRRRGARGGRVISGAESLLFMAPALLLSVALVLYPLLNGTRLAFTNASPLSKRLRYVGFDNFTRLLSDDGFWTAVLNSIGLVAVSVGLALTIGYLIALLCDAMARGVTLFRTAVFLVWVVPWISVAILWGWLFDANYGLLNAILQNLGVISAPVNFLADPTLARMMLVIAYVWRMTPFMMIISIAALRGVPRELREAASIDGAAYWQQQRAVVFPLVRPTLITVAVLDIIRLMQEMTLPWVLTKGGPVNATEVLSLYTYKLAFQRWDFGLASASGVLWLVMIGAFAFVATRWMARR
ncbi:MAG TPA: sugar ABC transporter permease [Acetobacteraceae bacterium]|jgi:multiple sugar transport system permease protein|nr:sugar ABC transporter permease [Acetobacteraceae bacterium]